MVWTESGWAARTGSNTVSCLIHYPFYRLSTLAWKPCAESNTVGVRASSITGRRQLTQSLFRLSVYVCVCASCLHLYIFRCMQPTTCSRHQSVRMCVCQSGPLFSGSIPGRVYFPSQHVHLIRPAVLSVSDSHSYQSDPSPLVSAQGSEVKCGSAAGYQRTRTMPL